jgi:predicted dehydrogenase
MTRSIARRRFLQGMTLAGVGVFAGGAGPRESKSPNERIRFGCIGIGGKGASDSGDAKRHGDVVAICDVDDGTLAKAGERAFPQAARFSDFRRMLDEKGADIDAVTVSVPDHMHAVASAMAMRMGKACFTQKPLTRTIYEARRLSEIARESNVPTQLGNQGTSLVTLRKTAALVQAGALGSVKEVHVWTDRPHWACGTPRPAPATPPASLHWDLWLGPAPERPYAQGYHPHSWRGWWDFGSGALGDMACHTVNMPFMALDLRDPTSVVAESSGHNRDSFPKWSIIQFEFPATDRRAAVKFWWYDGGKKPPGELFDDQPVSESGALLIGDRGKLVAPGDYCSKGYKLLGGATDQKVQFEQSPGHFTEFARAIQGGPPARSNFPDYGGPLTETILLGNLAVWAAHEPGGLGPKISWDSKQLTASGAPDLEPLIRPSYREGYVL